MRYMKYIVAEHPQGLTQIFLFCQGIKHSDFAKTLAEGWRPVSGGQVMLESGKLFCYGSAESLGLTSKRKMDTKLLNSQLDQDYEE